MIAPTCKKLTPAFEHDLKNPPAGAVDLLFFVVVALPDIGPVGDIDAAVGAVFAVEAAEPGVAGEGGVGGVVGDVAAAVRGERRRRRADLEPARAGLSVGQVQWFG